jgi:hypothetical protein
MVEHSDQESANSFSKYPTISTLTMSSAAPLRQVAHNLNLDFNAIQLYIIIKLM